MLLPPDTKDRGREHSARGSALFANLPRRKYSGVPAFDGGAVFPHVAAASAAALEKAAGRIYAEEHAAASDASRRLKNFTRARFLQVVPDREVGRRETGFSSQRKVGHELKANAAGAKIRVRRSCSLTSCIRYRGGN